MKIGRKKRVKKNWGTNRQGYRASSQKQKDTFKLALLVRTQIIWDHPWEEKKIKAKKRKGQLFDKKDQGSEIRALGAG